jgi:hypothetical protein
MEASLDELPCSFLKNNTSGLLKYLNGMRIQTTLLTIAVTLAALIVSLGAQAQTSGTCPDASKRFGILLDSMAPAGVLRLAKVVPGWGASASGLRDGDEILSVNAKPVPAGANAAALTLFLNEQPASGTVFRIRRGSQVSDLRVDKSCPPPADAATVAEIRKRLLALLTEQQRHFSGIIGEKVFPEERIGRMISRESTIHLASNDAPRIMVKPKPEYSCYFNRVKSDLSPSNAETLYALWLSRLTLALPEFQRKEMSSPAIGLQSWEFLKTADAAAKITLALVTIEDRGIISIPVGSTTDDPLTLEDIFE